MTTCHRRLVGRAHRRRARGIPITSRAVAAAYTLDQAPTLYAVFEHVLRQVRATGDTIRDSVQSALRLTQTDYTLVPPLPPRPVRRRPSGPLIHNGRKPR